MDAKQELEVFDESQDTWEQAVRDCQAKILAIVSLLVEKNVCTESEFVQRVARFDRRLEEERTRRNDARRDLAQRARHDNVQKLHDLLTLYLHPGDPFSLSIEMFRHEVGVDLVPPGTIFVRVVSKVFAGMSVGVRNKAVAKDVITPFCTEHGEHVTSVLLTPEEKSTALRSLYFDKLLEDLDLKPLAEEQ